MLQQVACLVRQIPLHQELGTPVQLADMDSVQRSALRRVVGTEPVPVRGATADFVVEDEDASGTGAGGWAKNQGRQ